MTLSRRLMMPIAAAPLALVAACARPAAGPTASLPPDAIQGAGDPLRSAAISTAFDFGSPRRLAGQPAEAARAIAEMEYLAVVMPNNPLLSNIPPTLPTQLAPARQEWRGALGIPAGAPPQPVINALYAAARALDAGQPQAAAGALPAGLFAQGGQATVARLANLQPLPQTNAAAVSASDALRREPAREPGVR